ncbi:ferritin-like domain-containing protein [Thalassobius sp. I31.1]|uniref:ferritin-like domain-containing protein n=1 Tax=Thalassobius sp. I31.1 TaxID=2109912 RepID=UPI0018E586F2|nr:ferritin-like domain-containing protein [Thalassobius sp. I31.1]
MDLSEIDHIGEEFNLSIAEKFMVMYLNTSMTRTAALSRLKADLQAAISVELATIPIYLYTYYSLKRDNSTGENVNQAQLFANKAGGVIMSVAVEEMLHMSLSSNIYYALTGTPPKLYMNAPPIYPAMLPHHNPVGPPGPRGGTDTHIPLGKFGFEQLWHFLQIEYPEVPSNETFEALSEAEDLETTLRHYLHQHGWPADENWNSIGQFYSFIRCLIASDHVTDADFSNGDKDQQIQHYNYAPNNIDTIYPEGKFNPWKPAPKSKWTTADANASGITQPDFMGATVTGAADVTQFPNAPDSHAGDFELITVHNRQDAMNALETICEQGEGYADPGGTEGANADANDEEDSHFFKFLSLQAQLKEFKDTKEQLPAWMADSIQQMETWERYRGEFAVWSEEDMVAAQVLSDFPDSPVGASYPKDLAALNDFNSGLFQYMLIMTETLYMVPPGGNSGASGLVENQKWFFNVGLHRSMIWVMDKWIKFMRGIEISEGPYKGKMLAPTFENLSLGHPEDAFENLKALGAKARAAGAAIGNTGGDSIIDQALSLMDGTHSMHLPDVAPYWKSKEGN